jgi:holo-[acyl-carrier protein] synthase
MIVGIGTDIIEVPRIGRLVGKYGQRFLDKVFTPAEQEICLGCENESQRLAGRFAAKEAVMKALGTGWAQGVRFQDIEVSSDEKQPPRVELRGIAAQRARELRGHTCHLSITHIADYALAFVILEDSGSGDS